jgi:diphthamide synthase (EF-2-diphthine--ammonia ligase)
MAMLSSKMDQYIALSRDPKQEDLMFQSLRIQLSTHLESALDCIDFVRQRKSMQEKEIKNLKEQLMRLK